MKVTFKDEAGLKALYGQDLQEDFAWFLGEIAGKEYKVNDFYVNNGKKYFKISTAEVGADGGFNTNSSFEHFAFTDDACDTVDFEGETYWVCGDCGTIVNPAKQKEQFKVKLYSEVGIADSSCPLCFVKSFKEVK